MALAERDEMLPGVAPREAWCRRMNMHMMRAGRPRSQEAPSGAESEEIEPVMEAS